MNHSRLRRWRESLAATSEAFSSGCICGWEDLNWFTTDGAAVESFDMHVERETKALKKRANYRHVEVRMVMMRDGLNEALCLVDSETGLIIGRQRGLILETSMDEATIAKVEFIVGACGRVEGLKPDTGEK